jgi:alpha-glucuronidase
MHRFFRHASTRLVSPVGAAALATFAVFLASSVQAEDGYDLWLRYAKVESPQRLSHYRDVIGATAVVGAGPTRNAIRDELARALPRLLGKPVAVSSNLPNENGLIAGSIEELAKHGIHPADVNGDELGKEGYAIRTQVVNGRQAILVTGRTDAAVLYGVFHFLRLLQTEQPIDALRLQSVPRIEMRLLNHWDKAGGRIEQGFAGRSLWKWDELPRKIDPRYRDYARACASVGINGAVLNSINAESKILSHAYLRKAAALADVLRPYGVRVYLSPRFSSPKELSRLATCDPRDPAVALWWRDKAREIHDLIPDFGGFLVKANSEGQPGPQDYGATHVDGANMLAAAVAPFGARVLWRAFVYDLKPGDDRARCAMDEFAPLDGQFQENVLVQAKNGPLDFQPREPFSPLVGRMPKTPLAMELQVTQEYLGRSTYLVFLAPLWKEILDAETYARGPGSSVARVVDGTLDGHAISAIAGVANTGSDRNWCGHHMAQANWYAFGRLAWDHRLTSDEIADEWVRMTWSNHEPVVATMKSILLGSHQAAVDYTTPLGLNFLCIRRDHYTPAPETRHYFHCADAAGIGYDRSRATGSRAVEQYHEPLASQLDSVETCPERFLLWFHHVPWNHQMPSGRTLWEELQRRYAAGVAACDRMAADWNSLEGKVDQDRFAHVRSRLEGQRRAARQWQETCVDYFRQLAEPTRKTPTSSSRPTPRLPSLAPTPTCRPIFANVS